MMMKMPISTTTTSGADEQRNEANNIDYKQKYRNLKRKLKLLLYENECYNEEIRKCQKQLLQVNRDKCFLLDKLISLENIHSTSSDSDATDSSDSDNDHPTTEDEKSSIINKRKKSVQSKEIPPPAIQPQPRVSGKNLSQLASSIANASGKKKKPLALPAITRSKTSVQSQTMTNSVIMVTTTAGTATAASSSVNTPLAAGVYAQRASKPMKIKPDSTIIKDQNTDKLEPQSTVHMPVSSNTAATSAGVAATSSLDSKQLTKELERHLESRSLKCSSLLIPEKASLTVPVELFSNESSTGLPDDRK